jgi:hypothetical protein
MMGTKSRAGERGSGRFQRTAGTGPDRARRFASQQFADAYEGGLCAGRRRNRSLPLCRCSRLKTVLSCQRAGHPARFPTRAAFRRPHASCSFSRLAAKKRLKNWRVRSFVIRTCQLAAPLPSRSKIPASSAEIAALPLRKSRPV